VLSVIAIAIELRKIPAVDRQAWTRVFLKTDCIVVHGHSLEVIVQRADGVKGLSETQLFNDRPAGRFWHFLATVT
jgi:hypothetical protein